jgi:Fe-S cluster assembly ATPase SufC
VHVLHRGRVVVSGGHDLARRIESDGYDPILGAGTAGAAARNETKGIL